jgi:pyruvate-formate lyase-activating enzyme
MGNNMGHEFCPYCHNTDHWSIHYLGKNNDFDFYKGKMYTISTAQCDKCRRTFRVVADAGNVITCLKMDDISDLE